MLHVLILQMKSVLVRKDARRLLISTTSSARVVTGAVVGRAEPVQGSSGEVGCTHLCMYY